MSFAIITDSTSDISPARAQELGIYVIPLHVIIEGEDLLDQVQITAEEYVARMAGSEQLPHTSQPSAGEFKALFDRVLADGGLVYRTHGLGYVYVRHSAGHTASVSDAHFLTKVAQQYPGLIRHEAFGTQDGLPGWMQP